MELLRSSDTSKCKRSDANDNVPSCAEPFEVVGKLKVAESSTKVASLERAYD